MATSIDDFKDEVSDEVSAILAGDFSVEASTTKSVPHSGDPAITFPNLDNKTLKTKILESCVLYIDIRRSTELNLQHKPQTVSKLYSAFVRAMTRCAQRNGGHVRGIIGDRVMCLFDTEGCFVNAVETAQSMNSVARHVINKHFNANEISCGIGIDYGRMLVTKTGFRRHGHEQQNYRNLVWLGRPANVASKLTDLAGKEGESRSQPVVRVAQKPDPLSGLGLAGGLGGHLGIPSAVTNLTGGLLGQTNALAAALGAPQPNDWQWRDVPLKDFLEGFKRNYATGEWTHVLPRLEAFYLNEQSVTVRPATPRILMTKVVYDGYRAAQPNAKSITERWYKEYALKVPGYTGKVYGGDVIWLAFSH
jgi:adenylate cyclase